MASANKRTVRLGLEALEAREVPATLVRGPLDVGLGNTRTDESVARSDNGNTVTVWEQGGAINARVYHPTTGWQSSVVRVNTNSVGDSEPTVAITGNGRFVVAWSHAVSSTNRDVYAQRFDALGNRSGSRITIASNPKNESHPEVAMDASANFAVAYEYDYSPTDTDIYVGQFNSAGTFLRPVFVATSGQNERDPSIDMNAAGQFVVAYEYNSSAAPIRVFAKSYNPSGGAATGAIGMRDWGAYDPSVGIDASGNYVVAYTRDTYNSFSTAVYAQQVSSTGQLASYGPLAVGWTNFRPQSNASVDMAADGRFVVAYVSHYSATDLDVVAHQFTNWGWSAAGPFYVSGATTAAETAPTVAMDSFGNFTVGYTNRNLSSGSSWVNTKLYGWW